MQVGQQVPSEPRFVERTIAGRYRATRVLERAQGLTTYFGKDLLDGSDVVIKMAPAEVFGGTAWVRLEYEVAVLNQQGDSIISREVHLARDRSSVFYIRPFVPGTPLEDRLQDRPMSAVEGIALGTTVLRALTRIHPYGVLHRGLRPSNIILADGAANRAQVVDCGIARYPRMSDTLGRPTVQAAQYLSPEQSGLIDVSPDARSDLYSVGVILYEALGGRPPFVGRDVGEMLRKHLTAHPAPLATLATGVPIGLEKVIARLLRKDPRDRYQTAAGALADLEELGAALASGIEDPEIVVGGKDLRVALAEPAFIGRTREMAAIEDALVATREGDGGLVLIEGESGRGKSWLLAELGRRAMSLGARVLHGRGRDAVAQRPYHALEGIVHELVSTAHIDPAWGRAIADRLGSHSGAATASLPELRAILPDNGYASLGPELHGEARSTAALTELIGALGSEKQPVVLVLDDAQWTDEATMRLLARWQDHRPPGERHVAVVLAFRPEEITDSHPLRSMRPLHHLRLSEFGPDEVRQQIASMAGQLPEDVIEAVQRHAGGNPFLVAATLHGMVEVGALQSSPAGWQVNPGALAELQAAEHALHILTLRMSKLAETPRRLLSVAALLGRTFDPVLAGTLAGLEPHESMRIAEECRGTLVWADGSGTSFTFVHDRLRDALIESLSENDRKRIHSRAADQIEATDPDRVYELAYHLDAAGDAERALPFALRAAERARKRFALELAESYYRIALRGDSVASPRTCFSLRWGLGDVLALRNSYGEAVEHYRRAIELADDELGRARVEKSWSQLEMKRGDMRAACEHAERALRLIGHRVPRGQLLLLTWSLWEASIQTLHTHFPKLFVRPRKKKGSDDEELFAIDVYHGLNGPYFFSRGVAWAGWAHLRLINLAERHPGSRALGRAYAAHAVLFNGFPRFFRRGLRISKAGADLCEQLGDPWGQAQGLTFHAMMLFYLGHFEEAVEVGKQAAQLFDRTGDRWEANSGLDFAVDALVRMGDLRGAVLLAREIWRRGLEIGDSHAMAWSLDAWSRATDGQIPVELVDIARSRARDRQTSIAVAQADGLRLIAAGRYAEAVEVLDAGYAHNEEEGGYFFELNAPLLMNLVTALRKQTETTSPWNPEQRKTLLARAKKVSKQALSVAHKFRFSLPHALREAAFLAAIEGDSKRARRLIDQSVATAEELREAYERAQSRLARAELADELGWTDAPDDLDTVREEIEAMRGSARAALEPTGQPAAPREVTLSLIDRFATIVESGRGIATALSPDSIYAEARRAALLLLRSEHCVVLERSADLGSRELVPVHGDIGIAYNQELIWRAFAESHSVVASAAELPGAARSVLCIPVRVRGEAYACLYLTHSGVSDLFGDDELRIGDFVGSLAGAALENAEGFSQLRSLSRELEERVEERTAQLARANAELTESLVKVKETHEQLVQASKMAALGTLVAGLSHELNNPLSVVLGYVQLLLRQTPEDSPARGPLAAIERQALRCSGLATALLDFSRAKPATRVPTSPSSICTTVIDLVTAKARENQVQLVYEPAESLPDIVVSTQEIESVLLNVLSNAIDATPEEGTVTLEAGAATQNGAPGLVFTVADTGAGIPSDVLPRIFDPFFTTKSMGRGTGLGLSMAHQTVTAHGGTFDVSTVEGEGTSIAIWLPLTDGN